MAAGDDDPAALDVAKAVAGAGGEVVGLTIGDGETAWALARGVEAAFAAHQVGPLTDESATAQALAQAVRELGVVDAVVIGDASAHPGVAPALAAHLGWPALLAVGSVEPVAERLLKVTRRTGNDVETITVATPVVLGAAAAGEEARPPGMMETIKARKKPVTQLAVTPPPESVSSAGTRLPATSGAKLLDGSPEEAAAALVAALRGDGLL
jgi:electron transfer flavoprotein beta subunit